MSRILYATLCIVLAMILIAYVSYVSWMYYAASCQKIRDFPIPTQVPSRCIGVEL